jgi:hypothetical protein
MPYLFANHLGLILLFFWTMVAHAEAIFSNEGTSKISIENRQLMKDTIIIQVGTTSFKATLETNAAATSLKAMLPMTLEMKDLNSNEKFSDLSRSLPTNTFNPGTIHTGDLLLWGSDTLVLFYKTFSTAYSYTKLGKIENPNGLAQALGSGTVKVTIKLHSN